jgi:hypothetical protein
MPYTPDANELRIQAIENKMLEKAKYVSLVSLVLTALILAAA